MFFHATNRLNLPKLKRIDSDSGFRVYETPEGNRYPSITTMLANTTDKSGLDDWRKRVGEEEANRISRRATEHGTRIHELAELAFQNDDSWKRCNPIEKNIVHQIIESLKPNLGEIWAQETMVYSDELKLAGTFDMLAEYKGELTVIDFKTARSEKKDEWIQDYYLQSAFYAVALEERTGIKVNDTLIVIATRFGEIQLKEGKAEPHIPKLQELRNLLK